MGEVSSAKTVSSITIDLEWIDNQIRIVEAETGLLKKKKERLQKLSSAQQERNKFRTEVLELERVATKIAAKNTLKKSKKLKCLICW